MSYNMAADSMKWSTLNTSILIKLTKGFNLQMSATWDTYTYQLDSYGNPVRVNKPRWTVGKGLGRLSSTGTSFSYTFNNDTFKKKDKKKNDNKQPQPQPNTLPPDPNEESEDDAASEESDTQFGGRRLCDLGGPVESIYQLFGQLRIWVFQQKENGIQRPVYPKPKFFGEYQLYEKLVF